jgi:hypothetical protein
VGKIAAHTVFKKVRVAVSVIVFPPVLLTIFLKYLNFFIYKHLPNFLACTLSCSTLLSQIQSRFNQCGFLPQLYYALYQSSGSVDIVLLI